MVSILVKHIEAARPKPPATKYTVTDYVLAGRVSHNPRQKHSGKQGQMGAQAVRKSTCFFHSNRHSRFNDTSGPLRRTSG